MTARQLFDFPPFPRKSIFENNEEEKPPTKCFVEMPQKAECEKNYKTKEKPNKQMPTKKTKTSFFFSRSATELLQFPEFGDQGECVSDWAALVADSRYHLLDST